MKNSNETNLIVKKDNLFTKIRSFFLGIFNKNKIQETKEEDNNTEEVQMSEKDLFEARIKVPEENTKLLQIQNAIKKEGITEENIERVTEDLNISELEKLAQLYENQNEQLKENIEMYKNKILVVKGNM